MAATAEAEKEKALEELVKACGRVVDEVSAYHGGLVHWDECTIQKFCSGCDDEDCEYLEHCDCDYERFLNLKRALQAYHEATNGAYR